MARKALEGIRVLEYSQGISGPYCAKILADLGAEVIKIEPPLIGDKARHIGPFAGVEPDSEKSIIFLYNNTNKKSITLDLDQEEGRELFRKMAEGADVFIKEGQPEWYDERGIGYEALSKANPGLVMASLTPYGESGPYKDYIANPLNTSHMDMCASMHPNGAPSLDRAPTMMGGNFEQYDHGVMAAAGLLAAVFYKLRTGIGQYMELSAVETNASLFTTESVVYETYHSVDVRTAPMLKSMASTTAPCKGGYVCPYLVQNIDYQRTARIIGKPEWAEEPWITDKLERGKHIGEFRKALIDFLADKTPKEAATIFQKEKVAVVESCTPGQVVESEQFNLRGFFTEMEHPAAGSFKFPGRMMIYEKTPMTFENGAPLLGQDNGAVYRDLLGLSEDRIKELKTRRVI